MWDLGFKTKAENSIFPQRLVDCMVTYNYNLKWDKATRSVVKTEEDQNSIEEFDGEGGSKEYNEEIMELHNCLTDPEYSDESDSD